MISAFIVTEVPCHVDAGQPCCCCRLLRLSGLIDLGLRRL